jgi:hypothetical protein
MRLARNPRGSWLGIAPRSVGLGTTIYAPTRNGLVFCGTFADRGHRPDQLWFRGSGMAVDGSGGLCRTSIGGATFCRTVTVLHGTRTIPAQQSRKIPVIYKKIPRAEAGEGNEPQEEKARWGSVSNLESLKTTDRHSQDFLTVKIRIPCVPLRAQQKFLRFYGISRSILIRDCAMYLGLPVPPHAGRGIGRSGGQRRYGRPHPKPPAPEWPRVSDRLLQPRLGARRG